MSWSYSGDPSASDLDQARFYCQDTDPVRQYLSNEEILFVLAQWTSAFNSPLYVSAVLAEIIASKFIGEVNVSADGVNVDQGSLFDRYNALAASLRDQYHALTGQDAAAMSDMASVLPDWTIPSLTFGIGMDDNIRAGNQEYGSYLGPGKSYYDPEAPGW